MILCARIPEDSELEDVSEDGPRLLGGAELRTDWAAATAECRAV